MMYPQSNHQIQEIVFSSFSRDIGMPSFLGPLLKGYCTVFKHALKSLEITGIVLSKRMSKTARKNSKGLKSYKEFKF